MLSSQFCYSLMFCVFLYFTSFGSKSIKFQDYNEVGKLTFGWQKIFIFGKNPEWACLSNLIITFGSSIRLQWNWSSWKATKKLNKYVRNRVFLIRTFTMPNLPRNKRPQICTDFGILFLLGWKFQKRKRLVIILFGLEDLFIIFLRFLELLELL
jgi:hypothetical protein